MRKHIAVLLILVALLSVSVYGYMTYVQPRAHGDSTILTLNTTADIQQVGITDYHKKVKKTGESTSSVLSASQISDAYTKILKEIYGDAEIKLNVYGPFKYDNGKAVYYIEAVVEKDNFVEYVYMIVDGNKLPGDGKIDTIYAIYVCHMDKNDNVQAKLSKDDILKLAKAEYAKHRTPADNDTYDVFSYVSENKTIYDVDVNKGVMLATYDGDTGELLDLFVEEEQAQVHTEDECRQLAQETLNSKDCNYSQYLSLGEAQEQTDNGSTNYTYSVIYQNGDDKQVLGSIKINANNLSLISFDMHDPEVEENDTNETETVEDDYNNYDDSDNNNYDDSSSSSSSQSSSSSSSSSSRSSSNGGSSESYSGSSSSRSNNYYGDGYSY